MELNIREQIPPFEGSLRRFCERFAGRVPSGLGDAEDLYQEAVVDLLQDPPDQPQHPISTAWIRGVLRQRVRAVASRLQKQERTREQALRTALERGRLRPGRLRGGYVDGVLVDYEPTCEQPCVLAAVESLRLDPEMRGRLVALDRRDRIASLATRLTSRGAFESARVRLYRERQPIEVVLARVTRNVGFDSLSELAEVALALSG